MSKSRRKPNKAKIQLYYYSHLNVENPRAFLVDKEHLRYRLVGNYVDGDWYVDPTWSSYTWPDDRWKPLTDILRSKITVWLPRNRWYV